MAISIGEPLAFRTEISGIRASFFQEQAQAQRPLFEGSRPMEAIEVIEEAADLDARADIHRRLQQLDTLLATRLVRPENVRTADRLRLLQDPGKAFQDLRGRSLLKINGESPAALDEFERAIQDIAGGAQNRSKSKKSKRTTASEEDSTPPVIFKGPFMEPPFGRVVNYGLFTKVPTRIVDIQVDPYDPKSMRLTLTELSNPRASLKQGDISPQEFARRTEGMTDREAEKIFKDILAGMRASAKPKSAKAGRKTPRTDDADTAAAPSRDTAASSATNPSIDDGHDVGKRKFVPNEFEAKDLPPLFQRLTVFSEVLETLILPSSNKFDGEACRSIIRYAVVALRHQDPSIQQAAEKFLRRLWMRWPDEVLPATRHKRTESIRMAIFEKVWGWLATEEGDVSYLESIFNVEFDGVAAFNRDSNSYSDMGRRLVQEFLAGEFRLGELPHIEQFIREKIFQFYISDNFTDRNLEYMEQVYLILRKRLLPENSNGDVLQKLKIVAKPFINSKRLRKQAKMENGDIRLLIAARDELWHKPELERLDEFYYWGELASLLQLTQRQTEAIHAVEKSLSLFSGWAFVYSVIANIYEGLLTYQHTDPAKVAEVIRYRQLEAEADPINVHPYYHLGKMYKLLGKINEAKKMFTKAAILDPTHQGAQKALWKLQSA